MTAGSASLPESPVPPILVLGLGNVLLQDDGLGPAVVQGLAPDYAAQADQIEFLDGGTQGLALLGLLAQRQALVIVDALNTGAVPGTISILEGRTVLGRQCRCGGTPHESTAVELLAVASMLGDLPPRFCLVGIQPASTSTGIGLTPEVSAALEEAGHRVRDILNSLCAEVGTALNL